MANGIKKIYLKDLFALFEQETPRLDIILCREEFLIDEVQSYLEDEKSITLIKLEQDDLYDQKSILKGLYDIFFDEHLSDYDEPLVIIEAIEEELGELENCLLMVENFSSCSIETQAALLDLVIVSRAFKLLLKVDDEAVFSENENLWSILASRSGFLEKENNFFSEDRDDEESHDQGMYEQDEIDQEYSVKIPRQENHQKSNKNPAWYQMLPKYHIAAGLIMLGLVFALWDTNNNNNKQQIVSLQLDKNIQENNAHSSPDQFEINNTVDPVDNISDNAQVGMTNLDQESGKIPENKEIINSEQIDTNTDPNNQEVLENTVKESQQVSNQQASKGLANPVLVKKQEAIIKVVEVNIPTSSLPARVVKKPNWSPYQSDKWIKGVDKKYYTLQLMASYDEQGIRNFLKKHGATSQYAVYTTEKNSKPWHVIVYGVYQTHEFADKARKDLPDYLASYSPWLRSFADVQKNIK